MTGKFNLTWRPEKYLRGFGAGDFLRPSRCGTNTPKNWSGL